MNTIANAFYNKLLGNAIRFRPCMNSEQTERIICTVCGTMLEYAYMENRLYVIRCNHCGMLTLVKTINPYEAAVMAGCIEGIEVEDE